MDDEIPISRNKVHLLDDLIIRQENLNIDKIVNKTELSRLSDEDTKKLIAQIVKNKVSQGQLEKSKILISGAANNLNAQNGGLSELSGGMSEISPLSNTTETIKYNTLSDFEPIESIKQQKQSIFIETNFHREDNIINKLFNFIGIQFVKN